MGAGASSGPTPTMSPEKMEQFKQKLLGLDSLNQLQKIRLIEQMAYELRKLEITDKDREHHAAAKIQALHRRRATHKRHKDTGSRASTLHEVYDSFCRTYRQELMTNTVFVKLCKDCKVIDRKFKAQDCEMVWNKVCDQEKKIRYDTFLKILTVVAERRGQTFAQIEDQIILNAQVSFSGTIGG